MHLAFGSSAGTENDTCVSARIKIFMMTTRIPLTINTKKPRRQILLAIMLMTLTQKCSAENCKAFPLNLVAGPGRRDGKFSQLIIFLSLCFLRDTLRIDSTDVIEIFFSSLRPTR